MLKIKRKIDNYISNTNSKDQNLVTFLNANPDIVLDIDAVRDLIYSEKDDQYKLLTLQKIITIKLLEDNNRPKNTNAVFSAYDEYKALCDDIDVLDKNTFELIYKSINNIPLSNLELSCSNNAINIIGSFLSIDEPKESIISFLKLLSVNPEKSNIERIKNLSVYPFDKRMDIISAYSGARKLFDGTLPFLLDLLCYLELDDEYDFVLENKVIFQRFSFSIDNSVLNAQPILIVNPSVWFIKKWIKNNPASNRRTFFCLPNNDYKEILETKLNNNNIYFVNYSELDNLLLNKKYIPTNTLFFGNHFDSINNKIHLLNTVLNHVIDIGLIQYYDYDYEFASLDGTVDRCIVSRDSKDINITRTWLLPSRNDNNKKYKRSILMELKYGYIKEEYKNDFEIYKYEINKKYNIPYITSNVFSIVSNKDILNKKEGSLREYYRNEKLKQEKKTDLKREQGIRINLSDEISYVFTFSNKKRARTRCYFDNNDKAIEESVISPTRFKTKEEAYEWAKYIYPFQNTERGTSIRQIVSDAVSNTLINTQICLSTLIFINYNLFDSLPTKLQDEMKYITFSSIGEHYINQISRDDLTSFLQYSYLGNKRGVHIYEVLAVLIKFYDVAIINGNASENTASLVLKELRKNERNIELAEINDALTLKNLSVKEINLIITKCKKLLGKETAIAIGTLLRLTFGLEPNIVCAFLWKDLICFENNGTIIYQLIVRRQVNNDGSLFGFFEKDYHYRLLPIPSFLVEIILNERKRQLKEIANDNEEYLLGCTIACGNDSVLLGQARILSPIKLYEANRKLFLDKKLNGRKLEVPDNKGGTLQTNIDYFVGDIFKTNLRHYCLVISDDFFLDDVLYIIGNKATNTFYSNYYDFRNRESQYKLFIKLEKLWRQIIK